MLPSWRERANVPRGLLRTEEAGRGGGAWVGVQNVIKKIKILRK